MAEAETCQVSGAYEFRSAEGGISLTVRETDGQLEGTLTFAPPDMSPASTSVRGTISRLSLRAKASTPDGEISLVGTASGDCRSIRLSITMDGDTQTITVVKK